MMKYNLKPSFFTKVFIILLAALCAACQAGIPPAVNTPTTFAPEPTSTQIPASPTPNFDNISPTLLRTSSGKSIGEPAYSRDGKWLYVSSTTGIYAYDTTSYQDIRKISPLPMGKLSPDGKIIVTADGTSLYVVDSGQKLFDLERLPGDLQPHLGGGVVFSSDNSLIAQHYNAQRYNADGVNDNWVTIWRTIDGRLINTLHNTFQANTIKFSPDNHLIAIEVSRQDVPGQDLIDHVSLYDLQTAQQLGDWLGTRPAFLSDNSLVVEGSDKSVRIFDPKNHALRHRFAGQFAAFSADEQTVATLSLDQINLYQVTNGKLLRKLKIKLSTIDNAELAFNADGKFIAGYTTDLQCCGGYASNLSLWRVEDGSLIKKLEPAKFLFSPDGKTILTSNQILRAEDASSVVKLPPAFIKTVSNLAFTSDGQQIMVIGYQDEDTYLYPIADNGIWIPKVGDTKEYLPILKAASPRFEFGMLGMTPLEEIHSPDGKFLAKNEMGIVTISGEDGTFTVPTNPESVSPYYPNNAKRVTRVAFSPDSHLAAFGSMAGPVELWNLDSKQLIYTIAPFDTNAFQYVGGLAFSPDGTLLAIGWEDGIVRLYEINAK